MEKHESNRDSADTRTGNVHPDRRPEGKEGAGAQQEGRNSVQAGQQDRKLRVADAGRKNHNQGDDRAEQPRSPAPKTSQSGYGHKSSKDGRTAPQGAGQHKDKAKANNARQDERPELEDTAEPDGQFPDANTPGTWTPDGLGTGERRR